jgi:hypothetical protein
MAKYKESVTCPWCVQSFKIVATDSADTFACPHCGEKSSLGSLRNPERSSNYLALAEAKAIAVTDNLYKHTAAYSFVRKDGNEGHATGTLVEIGDRLLIATVDHARPRDIAAIELVRRSDLVCPDRLNCVKRRFANAEFDVAVFEIDPDVLKRTSLLPIHLDRIHDGLHGTSAAAGRVIGFPEDYVTLQKPGITGFHALCYGCEPVEPERWVAIHTTHRRPQPDCDVVVKYSDDVIDYNKDLPLPPGLPGPHGMSGGGLWQRPFDLPPSEIWNPNDSKLFAIQYRWLPDAEFLVGTQIIYWLKLVADSYPEFCDEIHSRFPRVKTMNCCGKYFPR